MACGGGFRGGADDRGRTVHGEVHARLKGGRGNQRHDGDKRFHQHGAIADEAGIGLVPDHLGRGAGRDERMEAGYRAAGDGDEQEGKQAARPDRTGAIDELRERRHLQLRRNEDDADRQTDNGADLQEGGQIIARRQQQPDRQHGGDEAIADQQPGELLAA